MKPENLQRQLVVKEAQEWLRTPYHHGGRIWGLQGGVDCAMVLAEVYHAAGVIPEIPVLEYSPRWHLHRSAELYLEWVLKYAHKIPGPPQPGDLVMYRFGRTYSHGAIVVAWPMIIHAMLDRMVEWGHGLQVSSRGRRPKGMAFYSAWGAA